MEVAQTYIGANIVWWILFLIVLFKGIFGIDLFAGFDFMLRFIAINLLGSLAFMPAALWLAARYGDKIESVGVLRRIVDSLAGSDIKQAHAFLEGLTRF
jgi:hypothetical protein